MNSAPANAVAVSDLRFAYPAAELTLDIPALTIARGEHAFLKGPSGSGKSTLLALLGGVLAPTSGRISLLEQPLAELTATKRDRFRANHVGFIFQLFNLLPYLSVLDNVTLPCHFSDRRHDSVTRTQASLEQEARRLLGSLGLTADSLLHRRVTELSIGQQQRVAAARALIGAPELLIADEPTSSLDADNRAGFIELVLEECARTSATVLFVSHDQVLGQHFHRQLDMDDINRAQQP
ncbi:MAG: ABC transporter ATP-binding protein [Gammaproteobacteria bacterium]